MRIASIPVRVFAAVRQIGIKELPKMLYFPTRNVIFAQDFNFMKNIVFDLGGVVFARDPQKCTKEFVDFFSFVTLPEMPSFWEEYDRGTLTIEQAEEALCEYHGCMRETAEQHMNTAIGMQEEIVWTRNLIEDLNKAGYKLYVLSNMSREFIDYLRKRSVYAFFDGEVISCEEHTVKPEPKIYEILLSRYGLDPRNTMFIDDRQANIDAAAEFGIVPFLFDRRNPKESCDRLRKILL